MTAAVRARFIGAKTVSEVGMTPPTWASRKFLGVAMRSGAEPESPACQTAPMPK